MELTSDDLDRSRDHITDAALTAARLEAATHLLNWFDQSGLTISTSADQVAKSLTARDAADPLYAALTAAGLELRWALLVVTLSDHAGASDRSAVEDARARGVSWQQIGEALGITAQSAHSRYQPGERGRRRGPRK